MGEKGIHIENILQLQELLVARYKYRKLNKKLSAQIPYEIKI